MFGALKDSPTLSQPDGPPRASVNAVTRSAPACLQRFHSGRRSVAPVVNTSSISRTRLPEICPGRLTAKDIFQVGLPLRFLKASLRLGSSRPAKASGKRHSEAPGNRSRKQFRLVVTARASAYTNASALQRPHRTAPRGAKRAAGKRSTVSRAIPSSIFEKVNQLLEGAFVTAERVNRVEVDRALSADHTEVRLIQRIGIDKGSPALAAEKLSTQRLRQLEAGRTDRKWGDTIAAGCRRSGIRPEKQRRNARCGHRPSAGARAALNRPKVD